MVMGDLIEFLRARIAEDEQIAVEASRRDQNGHTPTGEHWQWENNYTDEACVLDPMIDSHLGNGHGVSLRSRERYPAGSVGSLSHFVVSHADEVGTIAAMHIVRHDPARVLRDVEAKRAILDEHTCPCPDPTCGDCGACSGSHHADPTDAPCQTLRLLAAVYDDHPSYRAEWRPDTSE